MLSLLQSKSQKVFFVVIFAVCFLTSGLVLTFAAVVLAFVATVLVDFLTTDLASTVLVANFFTVVFGFSTAFALIFFVLVQAFSQFWPYLILLSLPWLQSAPVLHLV